VARSAATGEAVELPLATNDAEEALSP
jgi:hypothetical protein